MINIIDFQAFRESISAVTMIAKTAPRARNTPDTAINAVVSLYVSSIMSISMIGKIREMCSCSVTLESVFARRITLCLDW